MDALWITAHARHVGGGLTPAAVRAAWPDAPARLARMDRACHHALHVAHAALACARLDPDEREALAIVLGTALGCAATTEAFHRGLVRDGPAGASPLLFGYTVCSAPVGELAIAFGARGHQTTLMAGRCSGVAALAEARRALALGRADAALVLAVDVLGGDGLAPLLAHAPRAPVEAAVALLVERPAAAQARGRAPRGVLDAATLHRAPRAPTPDARDHLGASGLVELSAWLDAPRGIFEAAVHDDDGLAGALRARACG